MPDTPQAAMHVSWRDGVILGNRRRMITLAPYRLAGTIMPLSKTASCLTLVAAIALCGEDKKDGDTLQGSWTATAAERVGKAADDVKGHVITFTGLVFPKWGTILLRMASGENVPFELIDPQGSKVKNAIVLHGPQGAPANTYPESVSTPCNARAKVIHLLGGVGGAAFPFVGGEAVVMTVRLLYADGTSEDHELRHGVQICTFYGEKGQPFPDIKGSKFAFKLKDSDKRAKHVRYLALQPKQPDKPIRAIALVKSEADTIPNFFAVTIESP